MSKQQLFQTMERLVLLYIADVVRLSLLDQLFGKALLRDPEKGPAVAEAVLSYCLKHSLDPLSHIGHVVLTLQAAGRGARPRDFLSAAYTRPALPAQTQIEDLNLELEVLQASMPVQIGSYRMLGIGDGELAALCSDFSSLPSLYRYCRLLAMQRAALAQEYHAQALLQFFPRMQVYLSSGWRILIPFGLEKEAYAARAHYKSPARA